MGHSLCQGRVKLLWVQATDLDSGPCQAPENLETLRNLMDFHPDLKNFLFFPATLCVLHEGSGEELGSKRTQSDICEPASSPHPGWEFPSGPGRRHHLPGLASSIGPTWRVIHSFLNADPQQGERSRVPLKVKNTSAPRRESPSAAPLRLQPPREGPWPRLFSGLSAWMQ